MNKYLKKEDLMTEEVLQRLNINEEKFILFFYKKLKKWVSESTRIDYCIHAWFPKNNLKPLGSDDFRKKTAKSLKEKKYILFFWDKAVINGVNEIQITFDQDKFIQYHEKFLTNGIQK